MYFHSQAVAELHDDLDVAKTNVLSVDFLIFESIGKLRYSSDLGYIVCGTWIKILPDNDKQFQHIFHFA